MKISVKPLLTLFPTPLVISGPSGVGKSTLISLLFSTFPENFQFSVSCTTRSARPGEKEGKDYYFISKAEFLTRANNSEFIEHCSVHGNFYGTCRSEVENISKTGKICLMDIDVQGALTIARSGINFNGIFVRPADVGDLEKRLRGRKTDSEEAILKRLENAKMEIRISQERNDVFKFVLVNDVLDKASNQFLHMVSKMYPFLRSEKI
jgi:guanylate kinase